MTTEDIGHSIKDLMTVLVIRNRQYEKAVTSGAIDPKQSDIVNLVRADNDFINSLDKFHLDLMRKEKEKIMLTPKQVLIEGLKVEGLNIAEDTAVATVRAAFKILPAVFTASENKFDDMAIPVLGILEPKVMAILDKIDGEDDPGR